MQNLLKLERTLSTFVNDPKDSPYGRFGERIKAIRGEMDRDKFSDVTGIHKSTLARYENDARYPASDFLQTLCWLYPSLNPTWLLTGEGAVIRPSTIKVAEHGGSYDANKVLIDQSFIDNLTELANRMMNEKQQDIDANILANANSSLYQYLTSQALIISDPEQYGQLLAFFYRQLRDYGVINMEMLSNLPEIVSARQ